ncbi:MAG: ATP-binding protein [Thermocrispum sp.]
MRSRLPLRARVMVWFGLIALVVTSILAVLTWLLSTDYMIGQRERSAVRQATANARLVGLSLQRESGGLDQLLTGLGAELESAVLLVDDGEWISSGNLVDPRRLPEAFLTMAQSGQPAHQRTRIDDIPVLAVGLPIPQVGATYIEVSPLRELDRTFRYLSWILIAGTLASGLAGALAGRWAATHALRPLTTLTAASRAAAEGDLSVRLPATRDPDLIPLASAFNDTAERLQHRVTRDARFAGDVSHELRSPLTTMINAMAVLYRRRADMPAEARQAVELLDTDLRRFRHMVDDLLEISRNDEDQNPLTLEQIDLAELVGAAAAGHGGSAGLNGRLDTRAHPQVLADRRSLERVVVNLVDNAERHGHGLVRLGVLRRDGHARIEVDDAGPGVPAADRERVFERFARGSPAERDTSDIGVGLGLALVAQHAGRHEGRAWVEPRQGGGARFVVEMPETTP